MIWCVEDDASIRDIEVYALRSTGFEARGFEDGDSFWQALQEERPDLVILDVMLPGTDGIELLSRLRQTKAFDRIPVIMATAKGTEYDKIQGLDLGADDYLVKPFGMMEMVSRVKAVLRRCQPEQSRQIIGEDGLEIDPLAHIVRIAGEKVNLTYKEYELLLLLINHPNRVFTRQQIYTQVWGMNYVGETRTVDMHIRTLRQKLGTFSSSIETVRNVGYRWGNRNDK